jgi:hypothetical protein
MALRLVRQTSETPNITNKDDTIMTRYAYGGYNGIVKAFGQECNHIADNGIFKVLDGRIVIDGWEIEIDGAGWLLNLSNVTGTQYHSIYAEINVATESIKLDSSYLTGFYPEIDKGDDLTAIQNGTARLLLYNVKVENGKIVEVIKKANTITYLSDKLKDLNFSKDTKGLLRLGVDIIAIKRLLCTANLTSGFRFALEQQVKLTNKNLMIEVYRSDGVLLERFRDVYFPTTLSSFYKIQQVSIEINNLAIKQWEIAYNSNDNIIDCSYSWLYSDGATLGGVSFASGTSMKIYEILE